MSCAYQDQIQSIIVHGDAKTLVETAQSIAREMIQRNQRGFINEGSSVTTSQIRNIYGSSKQIEMRVNEQNTEEEYNKLILLKPKMAYANGRFNRTGGGRPKIPGFLTLVECLSYAIDQVEADYKRMQNFFNFFEAILAYHKAEGGK
ncbi:MAG: type III-A CRISPR-associated protein Csm2 [Desulfohalobiaceae bacterium]